MYLVVLNESHSYADHSHDCKMYVQILREELDICAKACIKAELTNWFLPDNGYFFTCVCWSTCQLSIVTQHSREPLTYKVSRGCEVIRKATHWRISYSGSPELGYKQWTTFEMWGEGKEDTPLFCSLEINGQCIYTRKNRISTKLGWNMAEDIRVKII